MRKKTLTIIIPTYNRSVCLTLLLKTLAFELIGLEDDVNVVIGDNASTDDTPIVVEGFLAAYPSAQVLRHSENLGPEENFCRCIDQVKTRHFWIIGDDDLPKKGVLVQIINLIKREDPDLIYLNSEWLPHIESADDGDCVSILTSKAITSEEFARHVNVWITFISGTIVNLTRLYELNPGISTRRFSGTSLVQLSWVLPILMSGSNFLVILERCVLATSGNTGGYHLIKVFGTNFPSIVDSVCGPNTTERRLILGALAWDYMPGLIWMGRFVYPDKFLKEDLLTSLKPLRPLLPYWLINLPLATLPQLLALPFWIFYRLLKNILTSKTFR
jgi:abequosyltransferase